MARLSWRRPPAPVGARRPDAHRPGSRAYAHFEGNVVHKIPASAGQKIRCGDIVTQVGDCLASVRGASGTGDGMNWGDVSAGAYMALAPVGMPGSAVGGDVPVYTYGARVEAILGAGVSPGSRVGVDLRACAGGRRVGRTEPVDGPAAGDADAELWQRVRKMSPGDIGDPVRGKALLGTVVRVVSGGGARRAVSKEGDLGAVVIEAQA